MFAARLELFAGHDLGVAGAGDHIADGRPGPVGRVDREPAVLDQLLRQVAVRIGAVKVVTLGLDRCFGPLTDLTATLRVQLGCSLALALGVDLGFVEEYAGRLVGQPRVVAPGDLIVGHLGPVPAVVDGDLAAPVGDSEHDLLAVGVGDVGDGHGPVLAGHGLPAVQPVDLAPCGLDSVVLFGGQLVGVERVLGALEESVDLGAGHEHPVERHRAVLGVDVGSPAVAGQADLEPVDLGADHLVLTLGHVDHVDPVDPAPCGPALLLHVGLRRRFGRRPSPHLLAGVGERLGLEGVPVTGPASDRSPSPALAAPTLGERPELAGQLQLGGGRRPFHLGAVEHPHVAVTVDHLAPDHLRQGTE